MAEKPMYRIEEGSLQDRFMNLRTKIQMYGGGFGNGKTACGCMKALRIMHDYPESHGAILRETLPKVTGTTMKEFFKWCPKSWIKSWNKSDRILTLTNGSTCVFGYLTQQGGDNNSTSNVLSATFDWALIDQVEDPGIVYKDFTDLLGRLRGSAKYEGSDPTMPKTGPRWLMLLCNPTRNWVYKKIIAPIQKYKQTGIKSDDLLWDDEKEELLIGIVEGSTYENRNNLPEDFIKTMEMTYKGQMKDRFLLGKWEGYEGLVYPSFDLNVHVVPHEWLENYYWQLNDTHKIQIIEAFDYGLAVPSAYGFLFTDADYNIFLMDGYYDKEKTPTYIANSIIKIRDSYKYANPSATIIADPAIFRRTVLQNQQTLALSDIFFRDFGIRMCPGQNDILAGITKVNSYLDTYKMHKHPMTGDYNAPHFYVSDKCQWFIDEITDYYWKKDKDDNSVDMPQDKNDHAMDMLKYALTYSPELATINTKKLRATDYLYKWTEKEED